MQQLFLRQRLPALPSSIAHGLVLLGTLHCWSVRAVEPIVTDPANQNPSDTAALQVIFGESVLSQNALQVVMTARNLPAEQRYTYLSSWVLPNHGHGFRVDGTILRTAENDAGAADPGVMHLTDFPESAWIVCPVCELVQLAKDLGRLDELRELAGQEQTILALVDIAANRRERVAEHFAARFADVRKVSDEDVASQWWADLIVLWATMANPQTADLVEEDYFGAFRLGSYKPDPSLDIIADYLALLFRLRSNMPLSLNRDSKMAAAMFDVFSYEDAFTHGAGRPLPRFCFRNHTAIKLSGHELDYLALRSPLDGRFEIASENATHAGAFGELVVAGIGVKPKSDLEHVLIGSFAKGNRELEIAPKIQPLGATSRPRAQSSESGIHHFWNSREVFVDEDGERSAPWPAVRSWRRTAAAISEWTIVGSPTVPEHLDLVRGLSLRGWASYYDAESNDGLGSWAASTDDEGRWTLASERSGTINGCYDENLLTYVRPLTWNAVLSYEFEYLPDHSAAYPCLGRSAFIIRPEGVWLHRITDGRHDRTDARPDEVIGISDEHASGVPSLMPGWNRARFETDFNVCRLWLNEQLIATHRIKPEQSRTFGFFHYRDQTTARVRNVRLTGDWPRELPRLADQPLAAHQVAAWDAAAEKLAHAWSHDFREALPPRFLTVKGRLSPWRVQDDGLHIQRVGTTSFLNLEFSGQIRGDFDIVLQFKDLRIGDEKPTWHSGVGMAVTIQNSQRDRIDIVRRRDRLNRHHNIVLARNRVNRFGGIDWIQDTTRIDESISGRFRLVREGNVIHGLYADGDSECFRYLDKFAVEPGPVAMDGLTLYTIAGEQMTCSVTLVQLNIRADAIDTILRVGP